jgi:hypothetical protein
MSSSEPLVQSVLLGEAVEHAPVAILVADEEMRYVAANPTARYPEAEGEFEAMIAAGELAGRTTVVCKDGSKRNLRHRSSETSIAGITYYVSVLWPDP